MKPLSITLIAAILSLASCTSAVRKELQISRHNYVVKNGKPVPEIENIEDAFKVSISQNGVMVQKALSIKTLGTLKMLGRAWMEKPGKMTVATLKDGGKTVAVAAAIGGAGDLAGWWDLDDLFGSSSSKSSSRSAQLDENGDCPPGLSPGTCVELIRRQAELDAGLSQSGTANDSAVVVNAVISGNGNTVTFTITRTP